MAASAETMPPVHDAEPLDPPDTPLRVACLRIARRLCRDHLGLVGLIAAHPSAPALRVGRHLALGFAEAAQRPSAFVVPPPGPAPSPPAAAEVPARAPLYTTAWIHPLVAVLTPGGRRPASLLGLLEQLARADERPFAHVVVDLSALRATGEHLGAYGLVDGVITLAVAGRTSEDALTEIARELPPGRDLGVVLATEIH